MDIKLFNTLSKEKELFKPIKKGSVGMYHCGPTVYDVPHLGNYRTFILNDLLGRVFRYNNYKVHQVMNITDVDDKTIKKSIDTKLPLKTITQKYESLFLSGLEQMNIVPPEHLLRATENIEEMIRLIELLLKKGHAYKSEDGIYFKIESANNYGELTHLENVSLKNSSQRVASDEYDKNDPSDFALWKFKTDKDGEVSWQASFGDGRPGWHIECSAMSMKILGPTIDIHTGGVDLIFPHHTNEIAQSESATGQRFVNYWIHGGFINVSSEKMAKSKGNYQTLQSLLDNDISPLAYRYWLLTSHYRSPVNFTYEAVKAAQNALIKLISTISEYPDGGEIDKPSKERFSAFINDDLDMPKAIALSWDIIKNPDIKPADKRATLLEFDKVFGLKLDFSPILIEESVPEEVIALADAREEARKASDWAKADALRLEIENRGYDILDEKNSYKLRRK